MSQGVDGTRRRAGDVLGAGSRGMGRPLDKQPVSPYSCRTVKRCLALALIALCLFACYQAKPVKTLPKAGTVGYRTLFIGLDGIDYVLMKELKDAGYFRSFRDPVPLVSTFPSATTIGFQGIFRPLGVKKYLGYETRFYSQKKNKIVGGTLFDVYKYPADYKTYFDSFRHTIPEKSVMYAFPGMASKQDLMRTKGEVFGNPKRVIMTYLGGTDGSAHILGRKRTKRTLIYMDKVLTRLQVRHMDEKGEPLRIVLFSDHGFHYGNLHMVKNSEIREKLKAAGFRMSSRIESDRDIVFVRFGLLSGGVAFANLKNRDEMARLLSTVTGIDLVFWHRDNKKKVFVRNATGKEAYFEYRGKRQYRYVTVTGDPLGYKPLLLRHGLKSGQWIPDATWKKIAYNHHYPDAGYRLYDAFFDLISNRAAIMFSLLPNYQYGSLAARIGTLTRVKQKGTHGGLFRSASWAFAMTNIDDNPAPPHFFRYDEFFPYYLPRVSRAAGQHFKTTRDPVVVSLSGRAIKDQLKVLESELFVSN